MKDLNVLARQNLLPPMMLPFAQLTSSASNISQNLSSDQQDNRFQNHNHRFL